MGLQSCRASGLLSLGVSGPARCPLGRGVEQRGSTADRLGCCFNHFVFLRWPNAFMPPRIRAVSLTLFSEPDLK